MERASIGRSGIEAPRLWVGCWQAHGWATSSEDGFLETVARALDHGLDMFDTAEAYGDGRSEELLGKALAGRRAQALIATKFDHRHSQPAALRRALEGSLKRLRTDYVDLYQQHWPPKSPALEETIGELERLKAEGKIRAIGVSNWTEPEWSEIERPERIDCLQPCFSLLWRSIENRVLPLCRESGISVAAYSPLCQGLLTGRFQSADEAPPDYRSRSSRFSPADFPAIMAVVAKAAEIAGRIGKSVAQVSLRWVLDTPGVTHAVAGASSATQLEENAGCMGWRLSGEDYAALSEISWPLSRGLAPHDTLWRWHPRKGKH